MHEIYSYNGYSHDLLFSFKNSFSPEINISYCLDPTQKYFFPIGGINITDKITRYNTDGYFSISNSSQSGTLININAESTFNQVSVSPLFGMECKFPVSEKLTLQFTLISINRIGYYYILNKYSNIDQTLSREDNF